MNEAALRRAGCHAEPLRRLELANASSALLNEALSMRERFAEADPINHYPYL